jgi:hypothetical protein
MGMFRLLVLRCKEPAATWMVQPSACPTNGPCADALCPESGCCMGKGAVLLRSAAPMQGVREVEEWMSQTSGIPLEELRPHMFLLRDRDATSHLMR